MLISYHVQASRRSLGTIVLPYFIIIDPSALGSEHTVHESGHVDRLGATDELMIKDGNELLASQIQAFLEAAEDVDVDAETIEDILQALMVDKEEVEDAETRPDTKMNEYEDSDGELEASTQELDISPLFERNHEGFFFFFCFFVPLLKRDQRRGHGQSKRSNKCSTSSRSVVSFFPPVIMGASDKDLFILGSSAFIEEYVRTRQIPIPKLLHAFGIDLVFRYELSRATRC